MILVPIYFLFLTFWAVRELTLFNPCHSAHNAGGRWAYYHKLPVRLVYCVVIFAVPTWFVFAAVTGTGGRADQSELPWIVSTLGIWATVEALVWNATKHLRAKVLRAPTCLQPATDGDARVLGFQGINDLELYRVYHATIVGRGMRTVKSRDRAIKTLVAKLRRMMRAQGLDGLRLDRRLQESMDRWFRMVQKVDGYRIVEAQQPIIFVNRSDRPVFVKVSGAMPVPWPQDETVPLTDAEQAFSDEGLNEIADKYEPR